MSSTRKLIDEHLRSLPEGLLPEVLTFLTLLASRSQSYSAFPQVDNNEHTPLLMIAGSLTGNPISSQEIDQELYGS
jgi:hypothetical protein